MINKGDRVVAIYDEDFNDIDIFGFGIVENILIYDYETIYEVKLEDSGYVIETNKVIHELDWQDYVDERNATVNKIECEPVL